MHTIKTMNQYYWHRYLSESRQLESQRRVVVLNPKSIRFLKTIVFMLLVPRIFAYSACASSARMNLSESESKLYRHLKQTSNAASETVRHPPYHLHFQKRLDIWYRQLLINMWKFVLIFNQNNPIRSFLKFDMGGSKYSPIVSSSIGGFSNFNTTLLSPQITVLIAFRWQWLMSCWTLQVYRASNMSMFAESV